MEWHHSIHWGTAPQPAEGWRRQQGGVAAVQAVSGATATAAAAAAACCTERSRRNAATATAVAADGQQTWCSCATAAPAPTDEWCAASSALSFCDTLWWFLFW
jgi:hypothetical protein